MFTDPKIKKYQSETISKFEKHSISVVSIFELLVYGCAQNRFDEK